MRLSSLELQGFKSFPDKTRLEFDDGITAVVGPNGSGKSNIADAMRWVLGEQSTKTLRGSRMEDVIFSGTQARKQVGYASVILTIDNSDKMLVDQEDMITIGRRLYRSGESEYRLNGKTVRLKDIHELFMDTGLGRDGYSIIGQGRIAEIVSAKSAQRREIFEEAAGIAKYRYRRTEAERQLEGAQENLIRLNDILDELKDRVGPLQIQAEKAKQYLEFANEKKSLEISLWVKFLDDLKLKIAEQQEKISAAKGLYENSELESQQMEQKLADVFTKMQELSVVADELRHTIRALEEEQSRNDSQVAVFQNDIHHNTESIEKLTKELSGAGQGEVSLKEQLADKEILYTETKISLETLQKELLDAEGKLATQVVQVQQEKRTYDGLLSRKESLAKAIAQVQIQQAATQSLFSESQERMELLQSQGNSHDLIVAEIQDNIQACNEEIDQQREQIGSLENTKKGYLLKKESRASKYQELLQQKDKITREIEQKEARGKLLADMEASMEGYAGSVKYILNQKKQGSLGGIFGTVSSLISTDAAYAVAIETALGGAMQNIVVKDENAAKQGIQMLRNAKIGRATFLPLTSVKGKPMDFLLQQEEPGFVGAACDLVTYDASFKGVMEQLLGRICIVDDLNTGTMIAKKAGYRFRIVTLDGQVINAGGSFTGGATLRSTGVLGRRSEIEQLKNKKEELKHDLSELEPRLQNALQEVSGIDAMITGINAEIQSVQEEVVRLGFSKEQLENNLISAENNRNLAKLELEKLSTRLKELENGQTSSEQLIDENYHQVEQLKKELEESSQKQEKLLSSNQLLGEQVAEYRMDELTLKNQLENIQSDLNRLQEQLQNADHHTKKLTEELEQLTSSNQEILTHIENITKRRIDLVTEVENYQQQILKYTEERTMLEKSTTELRQQEKAVSAQREKLSRELALLEERYQNTQQEYDTLIAKLWDEYELTRSCAIEVAEELEDVEKSKIRLAELKNKIRGLGSVNLESVAEYDEVSERYKFLSEQVADVETSRSKLIKLIHELTEEMRTLFSENFEKISKEFSKTFVELFGGGCGELTLEDGEDVLEAGIDIHVQPPGKVIKNLSLLSGGEQAFVAIAIYFAILKVKPAPFVLLDEIEAALDDVNVVKYAQYLRTLSDHIQFITITHRRGTMEEADVLYGVTMQENGISKLLELKVHEIESKFGTGAEF